MLDFVTAFIQAFAPIVALILFCLPIIAIWRAYKNSDQYKNPKEYRTKGSTGERLAYLQLVNDYGVPEKQILRNVYIPTKRGTTEIDLLVISKKGILIFECKNYSGNVYGDGNRDKWIQYLGNTKNYFLSPVVQNKYHVAQLKEYFKDIKDLPVIPFVVTTGNANWKLKNIKPEDNVMYWTGVRFGDVYNSLEDSAIMKANINKIYGALKKFERPDEEVKKAHIESLKRHK
ncbi:MAG: nuclease-related domain-containing protein [Candidatus Saccharibacteria bacterium]|nr:nuclease-related domain-containing protein [Candidatus Saccharibacteria bacterium]